ncbi:MAG: bifunctional phosphoglucose/phosphomannose isomerase [Saprospiraceae bacterium]|nr:bifunctional phosphoglucose/phosphomannose isomerase [Bacteroidia bacterium]NNE15407.1 bifunctional phosphoglucose/phosphomannose isomerase [Saprospiraceae bacterium]NNL92263.1 bifunctional phosphoglucose/phosphomannose isomerase [Saprospiraceae bacterium]
MMNDLIDQFPEQIMEAIEIGEKAEIKAHDKPIYKAYVAGLGGSGIGANYIGEFIRESCQIPYCVGKGYSIPKYVDENTLAICSSYSGNTEETLFSFAEMQKTGAKIVIISSGGKLIEGAKELGLDYIQVPANSPSPRACLGYSIIQQLYVLNKLGFIPDTFKSELKSSVDLIKFDSDDIKKSAKAVADRIYDKIPIIYTTDRMESVAVRLRQQINENAKMLCWHHVVPEMNHNELVGWREKHENVAVIYLRNHDDFKRNQLRIKINQEIISKYSDTIIDIFSKGSSLIEKAFYLTHLGDWISWYLSELKNVDAIEIDVINYLKSELAKV